MHHKRKRPKNARAGCLMCKYHKANGFSKHRIDSYKISTVRQLQNANDDIKNLERD